MTAINIKATMPMPEGMEDFVNIGLYLSGADADECRAATRWFDGRLGRPLTSITTAPMSDNDIEDLIQVVLDEATARARCSCSRCRARTKLRVRG
jgi:hypothetical protein